MLNANNLTINDINQERAAAYNDAVQGEKTFTDRLKERRLMLDQQNQAARERIMTGNHAVGSSSIGNALTALNTTADEASSNLIAKVEDYGNKKSEALDQLQNWLSQESSQEFSASEAEKNRKHEAALKGMTINDDGTINYNVSNAQGKTLDELMDIRAQYVDQGLSTDYIDAQIQVLTGQNILDEKAQEKATTRAEIAALAQEILDSDIDNVVGAYRGAAWRPSGQTKIAKIDQLVGKLSMGEREKLKGQGTITDNEMKMLESAMSILGNRKVTEEAYKQELQRIIDAFGAQSNEVTTSSGNKYIIEEE